jgi:hypothetical protein
VDDGGFSLEIRLTAADAAHAPPAHHPWESAMGQPLPEWLERIVGPLIADFQVPTPIEVALGSSVDENDCRWLSIQEPGDLGPCGFSLSDDISRHALTIDLADRLQDQFFLETRQAWGQPRPPCPEHVHPAYAAMHDGLPWWHCPRSHAPVAPVGRLATWPAP